MGGRGTQTPSYLIPGLCPILTPVITPRWTKTTAEVQLETLGGAGLTAAGSRGCVTERQQQRGHGKPARTGRRRLPKPHVETAARGRKRSHRRAAQGRSLSAHACVLSASEQRHFNITWPPSCDPLASLLQTGTGTGTSQETQGSTSCPLAFIVSGQETHDAGPSSWAATGFPAGPAWTVQPTLGARPTDTRAHVCRHFTHTNAPRIPTPTGNTMSPQEGVRVMGLAQQRGAHTSAHGGEAPKRKS